MELIFTFKFIKVNEKAYVIFILTSKEMKKSNLKLSFYSRAAASLVLL